MVKPKRRPTVAEPHVAREAGEPLGASIRALRRQQGLRLVDVAEASGLSVSFISQLERGRTLPSLSSLHRVAETLGTSAQALLGQTDAEVLDPLVSRAEHGAVATFEDGEGRPLVHGQRTLQPLEFVGGPTTFGPYYVHSGDEVLHVISGRIEVELGRDLHQLRGGDTIYFEAGMRHRWRRIGRGTCRVLLVLHNVDAGRADFADEVRATHVATGPRQQIVTRS